MDSEEDWGPDTSDSMCKSCLGVVWEGDMNGVKNECCIRCVVRDRGNWATQEQVDRLALNLWNLINEEGK